MKTHAKATFALNGWDEKPFNEMSGLPKLTRVSVTKSYQGDITGEGKHEYLMKYRDDGSASFLVWSEWWAALVVVPGALCFSATAHSIVKGFRGY